VEPSRLDESRQFRGDLFRQIDLDGFHDPIVRERWPIFHLHILRLPPGSGREAGAEGRVKESGDRIIGSSGDLMIWQISGSGFSMAQWPDVPMAR
jgi:hypothetical protein